MNGLDVFGIDYMSLVKGAGGLLSSGGLFGDKGGGDKAQAAIEAERRRLEEERAKAERSARTMKIALGVTAGVAVLGGGLWLGLRGR
jgi:hypothetical protein